MGDAAAPAGAPGGGPGPLAQLQGTAENAELRRRVAALEGELGQERSAHGKAQQKLRALEHQLLVQDRSRFGTRRKIIVCGSLAGTGLVLIVVCLPLSMVQSLGPAKGSHGYALSAAILGANLALLATLPSQAMLVRFISAFLSWCASLFAILYVIIVSLIWTDTHCPHAKQSMCDTAALTYLINAVTNFVVLVPAWLWALRLLPGAERVSLFGARAWAIERFGRCAGSVAFLLFPPVVWAVAQPESSFAMSPRAALSHCWASWRLANLLWALAKVLLVVRASLAGASDDPAFPAFVCTTAIFSYIAIVCSHKHRAQVHSYAEWRLEPSASRLAATLICHSEFSAPFRRSWLGRLGADDEARAAALVAGVVAGIPARVAFEKAQTAFAAIRFDVLRRDDFARTDDSAHPQASGGGSGGGREVRRRFSMIPPSSAASIPRSSAASSGRDSHSGGRESSKKRHDPLAAAAAANRLRAADLRARASAQKLGSVDVFLSHSWHDPLDPKWEALEKWAHSFEQTHGGSPLLWIDKACIDQQNINESLACLPVFLAGCKKLLILAGPTYVHRLWCVMEVFTFIYMGGELGRITLLPIRAEALEDVSLRAPSHKHGLHLPRQFRSRSFISKCASFSMHSTMSMPRQPSQVSGPMVEAPTKRTSEEQALQDTIDRFAHFDAAKATCFLASERQMLLGVIESGIGSLEAFNILVRKRRHGLRIFAQRDLVGKLRTSSDDSTLGPTASRRSSDHRCVRDDSLGQAINVGLSTNFPQRRPKSGNKTSLSAAIAAKLSDSIHVLSKNSPRRSSHSERGDGSARGSATTSQPPSVSPSARSLADENTSFSAPCGASPCTSRARPPPTRKPHRLSSRFSRNSARSTEGDSTDADTGCAV